MASSRYLTDYVQDGCKKLIRDVVALFQPSLNHKRLVVNIDCDNVDLPRMIAASSFVSIVEKLVARAIDRSPVGGEIDITICLSGLGLEIEVADIGDTASDLYTTTAFARCREGSYPRAGLFSEMEGRCMVWGCPCPQGGMAVTVRWPLSRAMAIAA